MKHNAGRNLSSKLNGRLGVKSFGGAGSFKSRLGDGSGSKKSSKTTNVHSRLGHNVQRKTVTKNKIEEIRERLTSAKQQNRKDARRSTFNDRRGLADKIMTSRQLDSPMSYRMGNGTVVGGLRSDQLLLQRKRGRDEFPSASSSRESPLREKNRSKNERWSNVGSMEDSGLTVSFKNNRIYKKHLRDVLNESAGAQLRAPPVSRERYMYSDEPSPERPVYKMYSSRPPASTVYVTEPVYDDYVYVDDRQYTPPENYRLERDYHSPDPVSYVRKSQPSPPPSPPMQPSKPLHLPSTSKKISSSSSKATKSSKVGLGLPVITIVNDRPAPKPHRPILDPRVQKEIAVLQGKKTNSKNSATSEPGVKNFRIIPTQTSTRLSDRFTQEKVTIIS